MPQGEADEGFLQGVQAGGDGVEAVADPELQVGDDLVVSAAGGVQLAADVADAVDQRGLDVHVNIFAFDGEREASLGDLGPDFQQALHSFFAFLGGQQAHAFEHAGMRDRAAYVLIEQPTIKRDRFGELLDPTIGAAS